MGFSNREADIYIATLKIGEGTAGQIAKLIGYPRSDTIEVLNYLKEIKIISTRTIRNTTYFAIENDNQTFVNFYDLINTLDDKNLDRIKQVFREPSHKPPGVSTDTWRVMEALRSVADFTLIVDDIVFLLFMFNKTRTVINVQSENYADAIDKSNEIDNERSVKNFTGQYKNYLDLMTRIDIKN